MVRSIGIDPGDRMVKVVELDGSYKKPRLLRVHTAPVASASEDPMRPDLVAQAVRAALDEGMKGGMTLGHPCREAVLRAMELPFKGADAIKKVVKSEIEGEIYTHAVDDMVVDFHEVGPGATGGTRILVASVPKIGLRNQLTALSIEKLEPDVVDLDTMALWRAAHWAGAFAEPQSDDGEAPPASDGEPVHAVVDIGARSVKIVLVEGEQLVDMRALRIGDAVVAEHVGRHYGISPSDAQVAVTRCLGEGVDCDVMSTDPVADVAEEFAIDGGVIDGGAIDGGDVGVQPVAAPQGGLVAAAHPVRVEHTVVEQEHMRYLQRIARELTRFLTASGIAGRLGAVWVTGGACRGQGVTEMLTAVFGVEPRLLDLLERLPHELEADEAEQLGPSLTTAIGLALGRMGGPEGFQLRQEDLALTRGFEVVKFPLAIACIVAMMALFVQGNRLSMELAHLELRNGLRGVLADSPETPVFHGLLRPLLSDLFFTNREYFETRRNGAPYAYRQLIDDVSKLPVKDRVRFVHGVLKDVVEEKQRATGVYEDISVESGLAVLVRWAEMLKRIEPQLGRFLVPKLELSMQARSRKLEFVVAFRGDDFRARGETVMREIAAEYQRPDSPFVAPDKVGNDLTVTQFSDSDESGVVGAYYRIKMLIKDQFEPFGQNARTADASSSSSSSSSRRQPGLLADARVEEVR